MTISEQQKAALRDKGGCYKGEQDDWLADFEGILSKYSRADGETLLELVDYDVRCGHPYMMLREMCGFLGILKGWDRWEGLSPSLRGQLCFDYLRQLCSISGSVLTEYFFCPGAKEESMREAELLRLFLKYPVWARKVTDLTRHWRLAMGELLEREEAVFPGESLKAVSPLDSDAHAGGRRVYLLEFCSGKKLVYKPRPMDTDMTWGRVCEWDGIRGVFSGWQIPAMDCGGYGYAQYLPYQTPEPAKFPDYFHNAGMLMGIVYWLQGSDMHYENVIAHGVCPYIVDFEVLAGVKGDYSVLDTCMLRTVRSRGMGKDVDYGAFTSPVEQNHALPFCSRVVTAGEYREEFNRGFSDIYRMLMGQDRKAAGGLIDCSPRYVFRPTSFYAALLQRGISLDMLSEGRVWYNKVERSLAAKEGGKISPRVIAAEKKALLRGDVPVFYHHRGTRDLYNEGGIVEENFFAGLPGSSLSREFSESGLQRELKRIADNL